MSDLHANLNRMEAILRELPRVGKRSELKVKADELLELAETISRQVRLLEVTLANSKLSIAPGIHSNARDWRKD